MQLRAGSRAKAADQRAADLGDLVLVGFAYVKEEEVFAGIAEGLQFLDGDLWNSVFHVLLLGCLRHNAAEILIVDKLSHRGIFAADRALGILAQFQLAEFHAERVVE